MSARMRIRRAMPADALKIRNAHVAAIRKICSKDYPQNLIQSWSNRTAATYREILKQGEVMFVAEIGDRIAGFSSTQNGEIRAVYIHPRFIGRGIASELLARAEREALRQGFRSVKLASTLTARGFYLHQGYTELKKDLFRFRNGMTAPCIRMKKRLKR